MDGIDNVGFTADVSNLVALTNGIAERRAAKDANAKNIELARYQNEWNLEQWNRENEYNHPVEVMKRLAEAGINPNLVYANGAANIGAAKSPQAADMHVAPLPSPYRDMTPALQGLTQTMLAERQLDLQRQSTEANIAYTAAKTAGVVNDNLYKSGTLEDRILNQRILKQINDQILGIRTQQYTQEANKTNIQSETADAQIEYIKQKPRLAREQMRATFIGLGIKKQQANAATAVAESVVRLNGAKVAQMDVETLSKKIDAILGSKNLQFYNSIGKSPVQFARDVKYVLAGFGVAGGVIRGIGRAASKGKVK